jgi:hypothetical protein
MAVEQTWYVAERAEALAAIYLTRRDDLEVVPVSRYDRTAGYDLLVRMRNQGYCDDVSFGVETKGTRSKRSATKRDFTVNYTRNQLHSAELPVCVFLFSVDDEQGFYRWLHEPVITPEGRAILRLNVDVGWETFGQRDHVRVRTRFDILDDRAVDRLVSDVKDWYRVRCQD